MTLVTAGRVGKPHGLDGSFYVERPQHALPEGLTLTIAGGLHQIARRAGTDERPLIQVAGIEDPRPLRGEVMLVEDRLEEGEWLAADLEGLEVPGMGRIARLVDAASCTVLELDDGSLVPLVSDAIERIDLEAGEIHVNRDFLG